MKTKINGFTLVELLVVITIIAILLGLSIFGLQNARRSARDGKRQADLESIRSGLELYKSDCNSYPIATYTTSWPASIVGSGSPSTCAASNTYLVTPKDPQNPTVYYRYSSADGKTYELCAALEGGGSGSCGGSCGTTCNYRVTNP